MGGGDTIKVQETELFLHFVDDLRFRQSAQWIPGAILSSTDETSPEVLPCVWRIFRVDEEHAVLVWRLSLHQVTEIVGFEVPVVHCEEFQDIHAD